MTSANLSRVDCVAVLTDHRAFDYPRIVASAPLIVDTRNGVKGAHPPGFRLGAPSAPASVGAVTA